MGPDKRAQDQFSIGIETAFLGRRPEDARLVVIASMRAAIQNERMKHRVRAAVKPSNSIGDEPDVPIDDYDQALSDLFAACDPLAAIALQQYLASQRQEQHRAQIIGDAMLAGLIDGSACSASMAVNNLVHDRLLRPSRSWIGRLLLNLAARFGR